MVQIFERAVWYCYRTILRWPGLAKVCSHACNLFKPLRPLPCGMKYTQNLDLFTFYPVRHDIGQSRDNQLQGSPHAPCSAQFRVLLKLVNGMPYPLCDFPCSTPVVSGDIVLNTLQCSCCWLRPDDAHGQLFLYLLNICSISLSLAKRPSSAALIPSLVRSICQAWIYRSWSIAWLTR